VSNIQKKTVITMADLANRLNMSKSTVSFVLSGNAKKMQVADDTAKKVNDMAARLGYIPNYWARSLRKKRTKVITSLFDTLLMNWAAGVNQALSRVLRDKGYASFIAVDWCDIEVLKHEVNSIYERQDEAVICTPWPHKESEEIYLNMMEKLPLVFMGNILESFRDNKRLNYVVWNSKPAVKMAINYLIKTGRKRIAFLGSHHGVLSDMERYEGYREAMTEAGLTIKDEWVVWIKRGTPEFLSAPSHYWKSQTAYWDQYFKPLFWESTEKPEAIFVINDDIAMRAWEYMVNRGIKVPDDVAFIGVGDLLPYEQIGLTTIVEPLNAIGTEAANIAIELIENPKSAPIQRSIEWMELKVRKTT